MYAESIYEMMDEALAHVQHIHEVVLRTAATNPALDAKALCKRVLKDLGQPEIPNVLRSIRAHLLLRQHRNLLQP